MMGHDWERFNVTRVLSECEVNRGFFASKKLIIEQNVFNHDINSPVSMSVRLVERFIAILSVKTALLILSSFTLVLFFFLLPGFGPGLLRGRLINMLSDSFKIWGNDWQDSINT